MHRPADRPALGRAGFTMVELLVALVIGSLLTGVIFRLMQGQAGFVEVQSARQEVQQNARGTLELISSELRAVPPGAITIAEASRIEFRLPRVWGILCNDIPNGSGYAWILIPAGTFPPDFPSPSTAADWGLALPSVSNPGSWRWLSMSSHATGTPSCPNWDLSTLGNYEAHQFGYSGLGNGRPAGSRAFVYQYVIYETGTGASSTQTWVKRNNGAGASQVMAGPIEPDGGLVFDYWCENGKIAAPGSSTSGFPRLTAVQVKVAMRSTRGTTAGRQVERDSSRVALRNGTGGVAC